MNPPTQKGRKKLTTTFISQTTIFYPNPTLLDLQCILSRKLFSLAGALAFIGFEIAS